jgi:hypothetical protein
MQRIAFCSSSIAQRMPQSQSSVSHMVRMMRGIASVSVSESANARVTPCSIF